MTAGSDTPLANRLRAMALFSGLSDEDLRQVAQQGNLRGYTRGELVFFEGDVVNSLLLLLEGEVTVFKSSPEGRELILARMKAGEIVSVVPLLLRQQAIHPASGRAAQPTLILSIPLSLFLDLTRKDVNFNRALLAHLAGKLEQLTTLAGSLSLQSARSRLAAFLIRQADEAGQQRALTQDEIAAEIGTVREIVARLLRDFAQQGWLERQRQRLVLKNRQALEEEAQRW